MLDTNSSVNPAPKNTTLTYCKDLSTGTLHIVLDIPEHDLLSLKFDKFTRKLISECENSEKMSDKLLMLEHIVRIMENNLEIP